MIEPLVLPEPLSLYFQKLGRFVPGPTFELFEMILQAWHLEFKKQMEVSRHHDVLKDVPNSLLPKSDGLHD